MSPRQAKQAFAKLTLFILLSLPGSYYAYVVWLAYSQGTNLLGPDPAQALALATGHWALRMLLLALSVSPLTYLFSAPLIMRQRRMVGLFALFYVASHFLVFLVFLLELRWTELGREVLERPYVTVGFAAFLILLMLGATSFRAAQRKLGRRWKSLHRLVYLAAVLAMVHVIWLVRSDYGEALTYGAILALLLGYRLLRRFSTRARQFRLR